MRITTHTRTKLLSLRLEAVPNLKQATINYVLKAVQDANLGIKQDRRDFLAVQPKPGIKLSKVTCKCTLYLCKINAQQQY